MGARPEVVQLSSSVTNAETIRLFEQFLALAKSGEVTGAAVAATGRGAAYYLSIVGRCKHIPTLTLGLIRRLSDKAAVLEDLQQRDPPR
jgi:hypothetical protein